MSAIKKGDNNQILLVRFDDSHSLLRGAEKLRDAGYKKFDCHSPFPIHGMDKAMGLSRSRLGFLVAFFALIGFSGAVLLQWWTHSVDYPTIISGKPHFAYPAYLPVTFALSVLLSAFAATLGMLILNGLPKYHHPLFDSPNFRRVTDDGFFISVGSSDPKFDPESTRRLLESCGGRDFEFLSGGES